MTNTDVDKYVFKNDEEIFQGTGVVVVNCNDKTQRIDISLKPEFVDKVNTAITIDAFDSNSIAVGKNNKIVCKAVVIGDRYLTSDNIVHVPFDKKDNILDKIRSSNYDNLLKTDENQKLIVNLQYKLLLTQTQGHFSGSSWTFNHSFRTNTKFYFVVGISKIRAQVWPFQFELCSVPFVESTLKQSIPIFGIGKTQVSVITISLDAKNSILILDCNNFSKDDDIQIFELEHTLFSV